MAELSLVGLRVVGEIARRGSFSAAADALGYTQSAVSRQVALAERAAGHRLFDRRSRGVELTRAGEIVLRRANAALAELHLARVELEDLDQPRARRVRLGAFSTAMAALVPSTLAELAIREPRLSIGLYEGTSDRLTERVASGRLDLAVVTSRSGPPAGVVLDPLLDDPLLVAMPRGHRLAGLARVDPEELREEPWIAGSSDPASTLLGAWTTGSWRPRIAFELRDWTAKVGLVAAGFGVTVVPGLSAGSLPASVVVSAIDHPAAVRTVALARRAGPGEPQLAAIAQALRGRVEPVSTGSRRRSSASVRLASSSRR
ncbi:MAG TPA: LysR family transcriptional regulator [Solirubrobacteraceae bacterium]|nr:LysR family transcriptional regulator [Solirubrobacteraceae bacterium]